IKNSRDGAITEFSATLSNALSLYRPKYIYEGIESTKQLYIEDFDGLSENENNYLVRTITPSISGTYSIEVTEAVLPGGIVDHDTFLYLYSFFQPSTPLAGLLRGNDDYSDMNYLSRIEDVSLTAGNTYYLVVTTYDSD